VTADRAYYETIIAQKGPDADTINFPAVYPERRIQLTGNQIVIGRHSTSRGLNPQIDLSGPPEDPGVSHLHAVLQSTPDGWTITDPGSTNGTTINDDTRTIEVDVAVPIRSGDRIHVGAWTTVTLTQPGT
jgi:pSer/pThr/pTyr-binding forkhead associated (FHA) protein